ncbi:MAG: PAS/PAC sensor signal transduction histidine kinase [Candidatus Uhrbacteria bacterium GW2011_GWF2_39_13]|uniref:histidine kinase n=1 Tax=Candidatus Uhrbacteria bacterium GW2011_GWF2_39_13 TaxID=1618995 RepID=A0A0G0PX90_9BACT|nr:MAG: PAS/PAC sensor signal transduction histidine kinase [Candidatus Uhrbacteria bacterium GW2011_GWF2_39_13]
MKRLNKSYLFIMFFTIFLCIGPFELCADERLIIKAGSEFDYPPFCIVTNGKADGFSVELLRAALKAVNLDVEFQIGAWGDLKDSLKEGNIDVLPLVGVTPERELIFDFTFTYLHMNGAIFLRKDDIRIKDIADLADKEIIVMKGDNAEEYALRQRISPHIISVETYSDAMKLLAAGKHDAVIAQEIMGLYLIKHLGITNIVPLEYEILGFRQDFSFAVKEGNIELLKTLNKGLSKVMKDGTFERLHNKWFIPLKEKKYTIKEAIAYTLPVVIPAIIIILLILFFISRAEIKIKTKALLMEIELRKKAEIESRDLAKFPKENPNPVLRLQRNAKIIYKNNAADSCLYFEGNAVEPILSDLWKHEINKALDSNAISSFETKIRDRIFEFIIAPTKEGEYVNVYGRDITIRKKVQQELEEANRTLEIKVKERTAELELLNKDLKAFNYSVSHDLRTPLRSLSGFSTLLIDKYTNSLPAEDIDLLERINNSALRMGKIIDSLLRLSQITQNKPLAVNIDMSSIAKRIAESLKDHEPNRKVEFIIEDGLTVLADEELITLVLENIIGNAWKFTEKVDSPTIEVGSKRIENETVFFVRDNGSGFNMEYKDKLFEAFQRLHGPKEFPGLGIGLAIVKRIIVLHDGKIWAESEPDRGATFYFSFKNSTG